MPGPGQYQPDPTEGITRVEDLPQPIVTGRSRNYRRRPCPRCGHSSYRDSRGRRTLHDLGDLRTGRPRDLVVTYSRHYCTGCRKYFNADMTDLADPGSHYTRRVIDTAVRLVVEDGLPYRAASWSLWRDHRVFVPFATIQNWVEAGGKKAARQASAEHLDWASSDFSGYIAADELYDGPFCILSIVDNRTFKRIAYRVLSHAPTHKDVAAFFRRFQRALDDRGLTLRGITTDGSPLYPEPIAQVFGVVPHQICTFHVLRELVKAVLGAVAKVRKELAAAKPKLGRGRPSKAARALARRKKRIERKIGAVRAPAPVCAPEAQPGAASDAVADHPRPASTARPPRADGGGLSAVRSAMPDGHGAGQAGEAADPTAAVRSAPRGVEEDPGAGLEKALVFLDERHLGATSNAVERGNRRYRKMQKTVYRVRTRRAIEGRLALDLQRERQGDGRTEATHTLHRAQAA